VQLDFGRVTFLDDDLIFEKSKHQFLTHSTNHNKTHKMNSMNWKRQNKALGITKSAHADKSSKSGEAEKNAKGANQCQQSCQMGLRGIRPNAKGKVGFLVKLDTEDKNE